MVDDIEIGLLLVIIGMLAVRTQLKQTPKKRSPKIIIDSCGLIDGRIVELVESGFTADEIVVPQFVLRELQLLADGSDSQKRARARFGLDVAQQLQDAGLVAVRVDQSALASVVTTDDKLIALSKKLRAQLYTTDYNLSKVASLEGVHVLNVNDLAQRLRPMTLPGEHVSVKILQSGSNRNQGVGYLEDGTMVVVDGAAKYTDKTVTVEVERMHQTVAGRMIFARLSSKSAENKLQD